MRSAATRLPMFLLTLLLLPRPGRAAQPIADRSAAEQLSAGQILRRLAQHEAERHARLAGYTAVRTYHFQYSGAGGARTAEMVVRLRYEAAEAAGVNGGKSFEVIAQSGSRMVCDKVLRRLLESEQEASSPEMQAENAFSPENYEATLAGREPVDGREAWVLDVSPRHPNQFSYRGRLWITTDDFAVVRAVGAPVKPASFWLQGTGFDASYQRIGLFWLPRHNTTTSHVRLGGQALLTIDFDGYQVQGRPSGVETARVENASTSTAAAAQAGSR